MTKIQTDIDLDFGNRDDALKLIEYTPATIIKKQVETKHNSGIYVTPVPTDYLNGRSSIDYKEAEKLGYFKLDFLNVNLYSQIGTKEHLEKLLNDPIPWVKLKDRIFVKQLIHLGNHSDAIELMPEPINSIERLAAMLSIIRPGKRHLLGLPWQDVFKEVWIKEKNAKFSFKKSHSISYSLLCTVHMRLLEEN